MTAKGATSSLNKGRRGLSSVTATSLLAAAMLLQFYCVDSVRRSMEVSKTAVFPRAREAEHVQRRSDARRGS